MGGRLLALDDEGKIRRLNEPARQVMAHIGMDYNLGDAIPQEESPQ